MQMSYFVIYNKTRMNNETKAAELLNNLSQLHTTPMGVERIRKNLCLSESINDVVDFCKKLISSSDCSIYRQGKNWYCEKDGMCITVNAYSFTIITAHKVRGDALSPSTGGDVIRPDFSEIKSFEEFSKYYWYREELQKICKSLNIDDSGMKAELNHNIEEYFKGNLIVKEKGRHARTRTRSKRDDLGITLTPQTGLIECGFCFNKRFRNFFSEQTGIKNFKFNVDMVATARKVKETNDISFTLGDLLDIFYGKKTYAKYDKISLQWNKFVQDFCADPATSHFSNKLKMASILWKEVRTSTREKIYTTELLKAHIKNCAKK